MKAIRTLLLVGIGMLVGYATQAQGTRSMVYPRFYKPLVQEKLTEMEEEDKDEKEASQKNIPVAERFKFGMNVGTGITAGGNGFSMTSSYLAPEVTYWASPKLRFDFQGFIQRNNYLNNNGIFPGYGGMNNTNVFGISGRGNLAVTDRISLHGNAIYSEFPTAAMVYNHQTLYNTPDSFTSLSFGVNYKISDNVHVGVAFGYNNGYNPYYTPMNGLNPMMVQDPFGANNPFRQHPW
jgi:hypothetical protein